MPEGVRRNPRGSSSPTNRPCCSCWSASPFAEGMTENRPARAQPLPRSPSYCQLTQRSGPRSRRACCQPSKAAPPKQMERAAGRPGALAAAVGDRGDEQCPDDERVEEDADRDRGADLDQLLERQQGQRREGPARIRPAPVTTLPVCFSATRIPSLVPCRPPPRGRGSSGRCCSRPPGRPGR